MKAKYKKLSKLLSKEQIAWLINYENVTTFEPMYLNELASGKMSFNDAAKGNVDWFEEWMHDTYNDVSCPPYDQDADGNINGELFKIAVT